MNDEKMMSSFQANSWAAVVNTVAIPLTYFFAYNFGHALNKKLQLFSRPRIFRIGLVGMMTSIRIFNWDYKIFQDG